MVPKNLIGRQILMTEKTALRLRKWILLSMGCALCVFGVYRGLSYYLEGRLIFMPQPTIFIAIFLSILIPLVVLGLFCKFRKLGSLSSTFERIGIPYGTLCSSIAFISGLAEIADQPRSELIDAFTACFFAVICGGFFATLGHFLKTEHVYKEPSKGEQIAIAALVGLSILFLLGVAGVPLGALTNSAVAAVFACSACFTFAVASNASSPSPLRKSLIGNTAGTLLVALMSVIGWLLAENHTRAAFGPALALGLVGITWCSAWLAMAGLFSNKPDDVSALYKAQWHALEIFALLVLLIYAPPSLLELRA